MLTIPYVFGKACLLASVCAVGPVRVSTFFLDRTNFQALSWSRYVERRLLWRFEKT